MVKRTIRIVALAVGAIVVVFGAEIVLAVNRTYLPTSPALDLDGTFGPPDGRPLTFVVLGDSTGAGVGAGDPGLAYPTLLANRLAARGRRLELRVFAVSGARVHDVLVDQVPRAEAVNPDLVFVAIGGNDATHLTGLADVRRDMGAALDRLVATGAVVVVAGPGDMGARNFLPPLRQLVAWRGRAVERAIAKAAQDRGIPVVPLRQRTEELFDGDPDSFFSADRFHPSAAGYATWADAIYPVLEAALKAAA